ncbi:MAG: hypothetical protein GEV13_28530 [Rhodospirillales bacterium]|nr:hypothetical protein [Rhodospirillales bacterium]
MTRPNPSPSRWAKQIEAARDAADDERFNIGHAAALLEMLGDHIGTPHRSRDDLECQTLGVRVEYLAHQIKRHAEDLAAELEKIEKAVMAMTRGAPADPEPDGEPEGANVVRLNPDDAA